jgi:hypothetical protein
LDCRGRGHHDRRRHIVRCQGQTSEGFRELINRECMNGS